MAKGNMLNGTVKGRIGNAVYYIKQGEQNIVKYNKEVANPRTGRQMYQRARFSNAGRFFTRGRQNYFKFAFEGKKPSQSDFNAFMKANINRSVLISRSALQLEGYPAIGKFIMSQGSLQPVQCRVVNDYWQAAFGVAMPEGGITTVGELSRVLISTGNYEYGDILTFVYIWTTGSAYIPSAQPMGTATTTWQLKQFILNTADTTPLSNYEMRAAARVWGGQSLLTLTDLDDSQILATSYSGFCCVHSRNNRSGLKVSTQELALGDSMQEAYEFAQTSEYIDSVIADWQSTGNITYSPDAILKGSLSFSASPVTGITLAEVPTSQWQLSGNTFYTDEEIYPFNLLTPAAIMGMGVVPGMFQAENVKGDAGRYVSFVQAAPNQVDVHIDSTTLPASDYEVRIYMVNGEKRIPICKIKWTSVVGDISLTPVNSNSATIQFTSNLPLPQGTIYVWQAPTQDELSFIQTSADKPFNGIPLIWDSENNCYQCYEESLKSYKIIPQGNNIYEFQGNENRLWVEPYAVVINGKTQWINSENILRTFARKAGDGSWSVDETRALIPSPNVFTNWVKVAELGLYHGDEPIKNATIVVEDASETFKARADFNESTNMYDVYVLKSNTAQGSVYLKYGEMYVFDVKYE